MYQETKKRLPECLESSYERLNVEEDKNTKLNLKNIFWCNTIKIPLTIKILFLLTFFYETNITQALSVTLMFVTFSK